ncbi:MAG: hypothetical protein HXS54_18270, partial [Theionarchaea archaeon]|nr:hypothetical protein [Theionarchaea archaeon]
TVCTPLFFEGPNYFYFVDFWNTSFEDGVDFEVYQIERVGTYEVKDTIPPWTLIKVDTEITEKDAQYNWILIGEVNTNIWIHMLVYKEIMPDDGSPVDWFMEEPGYRLYSDPLGLGNRIVVIAGKTSRDTQKAVQMFIDDIKN